MVTAGRIQLHRDHELPRVDPLRAPPPDLDPPRYPHPHHTVWLGVSPPAKEERAGAHPPPPQPRQEQGGLGTGHAF